VIGHLRLIDFILFRRLKLNGLEPEMGSGVCLCMGKVLGTPRHPFKKTVTSFLVFPLFAKPRFVSFLLWTNVPNLVEQYTKNGKCILTSFGFD
jgi:hypothetical protein